MTNRDLENLKDLNVPSPRAAAKRAAMDAALAAFDSANISPAVPAGSPSGESEPPSEMSEASKGIVVPLRQTGTSDSKRSFLMNFSSRQNLNIAASVAAMIIAAPFAFQHLQTLRDARPSTVATISSDANTPRPSRVEPPSVADARPVNGQDAVTGPKLALGGKDKPAIAEAPRERDPAKPDAIAATPEPRGDVSQEVASDAKAKSEIANDTAKRIVPPDLVGKSQIGATGPDTRYKGGSIEFEGLGAVGPSASNKPWLAQENEKLAAAPPPPASASSTSIASLDQPSTTGSQQPQTMNSTIGRRMLESEKYAAESSLKRQMNPYDWMGHADEQKAVVLEENRDKFDAKEINPVKQVATEPVSTFSIDVDTASYSFVRRALNAGHLPPKDAVRVEEMINYFPYAYPAPESAETPFKPTVTVMPSPWNSNNKLVHVAIKGYDLKSAERPRANIVLLMDVSGSMQPEDRLPLIKNAFRLLVDQLKPDDTVGIVTYASGSGVALEPTKASDKFKILSAIEQLGAGGSTAGAQGIADAYRLAEMGFDKNAVNRIILATDGDFNVGITDQNELKSYIERKRQSGIFLSILGVGQGNHNDALMQTLAQNGNGTAAYVDTLNEARKVLVDESSSTLFTIAKDVKVQIEWNPERVAEYRLIGYETRALKREDFNNDRVDAGDIGSGHTVTAIYEVTPVGAPVLTDNLRYQAANAAPPKSPLRETVTSGELGFLKLRYKRPNDETSQLVSLPITQEWEKPSANAVATEVRFSTAVAAFGQLMKGESYTQGYTFDDVLALAQSARGEDPFGYRAEFLNLVRLAKSARP